MELHIYVDLFVEGLTALDKGLFHGDGPHGGYANSTFTYEE